MFQDFEIKLKAIKDKVRSAAEEEKNTRAAYFGSVTNRKKSINQKVEELQRELEKEQETLKLKSSVLLEIVGDGNLEEAKAVEDVIDQTNNTIANLNYKISLLSSSDPKGDEELYIAAIEAFRNKFPISQEESTKLPELRDMLKEMRTKLEEKEEELESVERLVRKLNSYGYESDKEELIAMVEAFEGEIDVTGHQALEDKEAKIRFIRGTLRGIENTPAGKELEAKQSEGL